MKPKNYKRGTYVKSAEQLYSMALYRQPVIHWGFGIVPATFVINMPFIKVMQMINGQRLYHAEKIVK